MQTELQEIFEFLQQHVLFSDLDEASLQSLVKAITIRYLRREQVFPPETSTSKKIYIVRMGVIDLRDAQGQLFDKLAEGDSYIEQCMADENQDKSGVAVEDTLIYEIDCEEIKKLRLSSKVFDKHFTDTIEMRIRHAVVLSASGTESRDTLKHSVKQLIDRTPLLIDVATSISNAAKEMTKENVSSALIIKDNDLVGMVTDRDLRSRVLATGLASEEPVEKIMTMNLVTVGENTVLSDALTLMTRNQIHHLPVVRDQQPIGNLSVSDVIRHLGTNSAFIASDIEKAKDLTALVKISQRLPELQLQLVIANSTAQQVGEIFSMITDSLTKRLLVMAEKQLGPAPVPYVWLAGGSQGRQEQTSHSDQDNCLFIDDTAQPADDEYFAALSKYLSDGLNACGFVYCPGNAMATNPQWRQPVQKWKGYFRNWIESPDKQALMLSSIFFDLRPVYGETSLFTQVQNEMLELSKANGIFIAYMASNALSHRPPLGFFRNFVLIHDQQHDNTLDIKHRGIVPIVDIARVYALSEGLTAVNTRQRLLQAHECGVMSKEMSQNLIDAYEYIASLKNQHQVDLIRNGKATDNYLDPKSLSGLERGHLKDAFAIIKSMQEVLEHRYQTGRLG